MDRSRSGRLQPERVGDIQSNHAGFSKHLVATPVREVWWGPARRRQRSCFRPLTHCRYKAVEASRRVEVKATRALADHAEAVHSAARDEH